MPAFDPDRPNGTYATAFDPHLRLPYTWQWNATIDQPLGFNQTASVSYVGAAGRRLYRTNVTLSPNADFGEIREVRNDARSDYHALQVQWQHRFARGLQGLASYTYAHATDTASVDLPFGFTVPQKSIEENRAPSDFDIRHAFSGAATYVPPVPSSRLGRALVGGTSVDLVAKAYSAPPVDLFNTTPRFYEVRPDVIPGVPLYIHDEALPGGRRINPAAFSRMAENRQGNLGRNTLRGFPVSQIDLAVRRDIGLARGTTLRLSVEVFNVFNRANFASPVANLDDTLNFGRATQMLNRGLGGINPVYQIGGPRTAQIGARLQF
jgi:hypothetical protein